MTDSMGQWAVGLLVTPADECCAERQCDEKNTAVLPFRRLEQKGRNKANTGTNGPKACAKCGIAGFTDNDSDG